MEYESGFHEDREKLQQLLETVKQGDTIACTEVSRLSRSTKQLCEILEFVEKNKIKLIVGTFIVDCRNDEIDPWYTGLEDRQGTVSRPGNKMSGYIFGQFR